MKDRPPRRSRIRAPLILVLAWAALCALIDPVGNFPINDDWTFAPAVRSILAGGGFVAPARLGANLIAQAYWGALFCLPFGFSYTALRISTFVLSGAGLLGLYGLSRELGAPHRIALVAALGMAANPFYLSLSASFMTDAPFTALVALSLWLYARGVVRGERVSFAAALALAFAAVFVRQFGLVLLSAFGLAHVTRRGFGPRALILAAAPLAFGVGLHLGFEHWLVASGRTPAWAAPTLGLAPRHLLPFLVLVMQLSLIAAPYIGLGLVPLAVCLVLTGGPSRGRPAWLRPATWALSVAVAAALTAVVARNGFQLPAYGNVLRAGGVGPELLRDTEILHRNGPPFPLWLRAAWLVATAASLEVAVITGLACGRGGLEVWRSWRSGGAADRDRASLFVLLLATIGAYTVALMLVANRYTFFDRYLLVFLPPTSALLILAFPRDEEPRQPPWRVAGLWLAPLAYATFSAMATHDFLAWSRARWQAGEVLLRAGISAHSIDGGYEFGGVNLYDPAYKVRPDKSWWWVDGDDYVIASGPLPGYRIVGRVPFHRWLGGEPGAVVILRR